MDVSQKAQDLQHILASLNLQIEKADCTHCDTSWINELSAANPVTRLYWITGGEGQVFFQGHELVLRPGSLYLIPAHTPFRHQCADWMDVYWVHLSAQVLFGLDLFSVVPWPESIPVVDEYEMRWLWDRLLKVYRESSSGRQLELDGILRLLLAPFLNSAAAPSDSEELLGRLSPVLEMIEHRLPNKISTAELADLVHLQPVYFANLFSRAFGIAPQSYIQRRRVAKATALLGEPFSLQQIAQQTGFSDVFYFSRIFKKVTGISPAKFRRDAVMYMP